MGRDLARWDPAHVTPKVKLCMHTMFKFVAPRICMAKVLVLAFWGGPDMNAEMGVVIYMYLNIPQILLIPNISQILLIPNIYGFMV